MGLRSGIKFGGGTKVDVRAGNKIYTLETKNFLSVIEFP
jgi:hypothetical protein